MYKFITFLVIIGIFLGIYYYKDEIVELIDKAPISDSEELILRKEPLILREFPPKEVEIFDLEKDKADLNFTKSGITASSEIANVSPQISGKITDINVKVGDKVEKNEILIILGESLSTDMADLQYQAALESLDLTQSTEYLTKKSNQQTIQTTQLSAQTAQEAYLNAIHTRENTENILNEQIDSAKLSIDAAEEAYKNAKNNYNTAAEALDDLEDQKNDLEDDLDDLEDEYKDLKKELEPSDPILQEMEKGILELESAISQIKSSIKQAEAQVDNAKFGRESAKIAVEQAENGLDQLKKNKNSQLQQLDFAITTSQLQYETALSQLESVALGADLQEIGLEGQIIQAKSSLASAGINVDQKFIKSPIDGVITSISAEKGNMAAPGQVLVKIENTERIVIKTSVNEEEAYFLSEGDEVTIESGSSKKEGKITSISPSLNEISKKIDIEIELKKEKNLIPGEFVKVTYSSSPKKKIFVPLNSIFLDQNTKFVKVVDNKNIVNCMEVTTGQIIGQYIEVLDGLAGNEKIIKSINIFIEEGEKVALKS